jgi:dTDP-4-amino-4,6-dideoxygalactose transaminase
MIEISHLNYENKILNKKFISELKSIITSKNYILGNKVKAFEKSFSNFTGSKFAVGLNSGLDALIFSLISTGIKRGDCVATTSLSAYATALAIYHVGATPLFLDIDLETGLISYEELKKVIKKKKIKSLILVHLYGRIHPEIKKIIHLCKKEKISIIEDCAQSHGAKLNNFIAGSIGDVAAWSFYPTKNLGSISDSGCITTSSKKIQKKIQMLRDYGQSSKYKHDIIGYNSRMSELHGGILILKLNSLKQNIKKRISISLLYNKEIRNRKIKILNCIFDGSHVYHQFVILVKNRNQFIKYMNNKGIQSIIHYPTPLFKQKASKKYLLSKKSDYSAITFTKSCVSIPCHEYLNKDDINHIIESINSY